MCNRYRTGAIDKVRNAIPARPMREFNLQSDVYPGYPGMVIRDIDGERVLDAMTWGFPVRLASMKPTSKPKPINNARDDKLMSPRSIWKPSFEHRRCLIPLEAWSEPEGERGRMTCTWYSLPGVEIFAVGGIWRPSDEWGDCYSMVMVDGCPQMSDVHDRMPVILTPDQYDGWMNGTPEDALAMVRTCHDDLVVNRSTTPWFKRKGAEAGPLI